MKTILSTLTTLLAISSLINAEMRIWTKDSKTIKAEMVAKTETTVTLKMNRKSYEMPISSLSEEDQEYIKDTEIAVRIDPNLKVRTTKNTGLSSGKSARTVEVKVTNARAQKFTVVCIWIGEGDSKNTYGIYRTDKQEIEGDQTINFDVTFDRNATDFDKQHKAHHIHLIHNNQIVETYRSNRGNSLDTLTEVVTDTYE